MLTCRRPRRPHCGGKPDGRSLGRAGDSGDARAAPKPSPSQARRGGDRIRDGRIPSRDISGAACPSATSIRFFPRNGDPGRTERRCAGSAAPPCALHRPGRDRRDRLPPPEPVAPPAYEPGASSFEAPAQGMLTQ